MKITADTSQPDIIVRCDNAKCAKTGIEVTTAPGLTLASGVLLTGNLSCGTCGDTLTVLGQAPTNTSSS